MKNAYLYYYSRLSNLVELYRTYIYLEDIKLTNNSCARICSLKDFMTNLLSTQGVRSARLLIFPNTSVKLHSLKRREQLQPTKRSVIGIPSRFPRSPDLAAVGVLVRVEVIQLSVSFWSKFIEVFSCP